MEVPEVQRPMCLAPFCLQGLGNSKGARRGSVLKYKDGRPEPLYLGPGTPANEQAGATLLGNLTPGLPHTSSFCHVARSAAQIQEMRSFFLSCLGWG